MSPIPRARSWAEYAGVEQPAERSAQDDGDPGGEDDVDPGAERGWPAPHPAEHPGQPVEVEEVGHQHAPTDHLAVGEVDQAGGAEDQGKADRRHGDEEAELDALDRELEHLPHRHPAAAITGPGFAGREAEDGRPRLPGLDAHGRRVAVRVVEHDALGECGFVEQHLIGAGLGDLEEEHAFGVGGAGADLVAGGVGDRERRPLDRFALAGLGVLDLQRGGDRLGVLGEGGTEREDQEQAHRDDRHHDATPQRHPGPFSRWCGTALAGAAH